MTPANMPKEGQFLLAHQKELILNKSDTSNMLKLVDITRGIIDKIKGGFDFAKVSPISNSNKSDTATITNYLNIDMSSSGNAQTDRKSIKTLIEGFERNGVTLRVT
ncbi:hypothetical protein D3C74_389140 [compost metagenome]